MSFRWFIYYCSLLGGCAAYLGWAMGRVPLVQHPVWQAAFKGLFLGLLLAVVLTVIDTLWNIAGQKSIAVILRLVVASIVGAARPMPPPRKSCSSRRPRTRFASVTVGSTPPSP